MIYALIIFSLECGIPCEALEPASGPYTFEQCRDARLVAQHRYLMDENRKIWAVCIPEN